MLQSNEMWSQNSSADKENWERLVQTSHYTNDRAFSYLFFMYLITYIVLHYFMIVPYVCVN